MGKSDDTRSRKSDDTTRSGKSDDTIIRALGIVHEQELKEEQHVELALAIIPRLDSLQKQLQQVDKKVNAGTAWPLLQKTYRRTNEGMISAEDHIRAALAEHTALAAAASESRGE